MAPQVLAAVVQSSYCFVWDVLMDWGLPERGRPAGGGGGGGGDVCAWRMRGELLVTRDKAHSATHPNPNPNPSPSPTPKQVRATRRSIPTERFWTLMTEHIDKLARPHPPPHPPRASPPSPPPTPYP